MTSNLLNLEPSGRANCLCGSGIRFKNCCKNEYLKKISDGFNLFNKGEYKKALKATRLHITWYRLSHSAHTVPFLQSNSQESKKLLEIDIEALSDLIGLLLSCYKKCNILNKFPTALEDLENAINDERWILQIDFHKCKYFVLNNNKEQTAFILKKYHWESLNNVEFLTIFLDVNSDDMNQIERIGIAEKIYNLSDSPSIKLQYGSLIGIQYCLLNDFQKGIPLIEKSISNFEKVPEEKKSTIGRHYLALSYMHLGELIQDNDSINKAVKLFETELKNEDYSELGYAELWLNLGDCYTHLNKSEKSLDAYNKSLELNYSDLTIIFKVRVLIKLHKVDEASTLLSNIVAEKLSEPNYFDYVISKCSLAIQSLQIIDIDKSLSLIKKIRTNDPLFKDIQQELLVQLYDIKNITHDTKAVESALMKFNRYVSLKPNFFGIGIDINAMIDDITK